MRDPPSAVRPRKSVTLQVPLFSELLLLVHPGPGRQGVTEVRRIWNGDVTDSVLVIPGAVRY